jgi:hypothetical protein
MTPLLEHAFIPDQVDLMLAADPASGPRFKRQGVCRKLCAAPGQAQRATGREYDADLHLAPSRTAPLASGIGILRRFARTEPDTGVRCDMVHYDVRGEVTADNATPPMNARVQLINGAPLDVGAAVVLERPGADSLRCVVAQRLSRVNRYRLSVLGPMQATH